MDQNKNERNEDTGTQDLPVKEDTQPAEQQPTNQGDGATTQDVEQKDEEPVGAKS